MKKKYHRIVTRSLYSFLLIAFVSETMIFAADGFQDFKLGSSAKEILQVGQDKCSFGEITNDNRWLWKKRLVCNRYSFKGVQTKIVFEFVENSLTKIYVLSRDLENYFLLRNNYDMEVMSKKVDINEKGEKKDFDDRILQEKVHRFNNGKQTTYFFYKGRWEWEIQIERARNIIEEKKKREEQLENEEGEGLKGWNKFKFDDSISRVKEKVEGMCEALNVDEVTYLKEKKVIVCHNFPFLGKKADLRFGFYDGKLVDVELTLRNEFYHILLPFLKRKYGRPYKELIDSKDHYPYIIFPKQNISLSYKRDNLAANNTWVSLKYVKEGYIDPKEKIIIEQRKRKIKKRKPTRENREEMILKSI